MKTELAYTDITENLCQHCAYCCLNTYIPIDCDQRTYEYYKGVGLDVEWDGGSTGVINGGACQYLTRDGDTYRCSIYTTRPQLCADYSCVAWAKVSGVESDIVKHALDVYHRINIE